tara:strand:- start:449 stop:643 length:195 start_codon:yes stop_codon:yes gene_type:complete
MVDSVTSLLQIWHSMLFSSAESSCKKGSAEMEKAKNKPEKTSKALLGSEVVDPHECDNVTQFSS